MLARDTREAAQPEQGGGAQKRSTRSANAIALQATRCFSVSETQTAANLACQPSILLLTLAHWPLSLTQSEMNSVHPPAHSHNREEQLLLETDRHAACPAGHLTLAAAEAVCTYSGHHLLQSNLNMTFALLSSFPPPEPQENPGISTAKHQLHCKNRCCSESGTLLTPDPKRDKMAPFPHPQLCTQQSNSNFSCFN